jgi:hypothetical protein
LPCHREARTCGPWRSSQPSPGRRLGPSRNRSPAEAWGSAGGQDGLPRRLQSRAPRNDKLSHYRIWRRKSELARPKSQVAAPMPRITLEPDKIRRDQCVPHNFSTVTRIVLFSKHVRSDLLSASAPLPVGARRGQSRHRRCPLSPLGAISDFPDCLHSTNAAVFPIV